MPATRARCYPSFSTAIGGAIFSGALSTVHITRLVEIAAYVGIIALATTGVYMAFLLHRGAAPTEQKSS